MAKKPRLWTDYPPQYALFIKNVAMASLPALYGPFSRGEANTMRRRFYHYRDTLRESRGHPGSYPDLLYQQIEILSAKVEPSTEEPHLWNVIFDLDPIVATMEKMAPDAAQERQLSHIKFVASESKYRQNMLKPAVIPQRPPNISEPMFSDEEMQERIDEFRKE